MSKWQTTPFYCVLENALHTKITSMFYGFYMKFNHSKDVENEVYIVYKVSKQTFGFAHLIAWIINICWLRETESQKRHFLTFTTHKWNYNNSIFEPGFWWLMLYQNQIQIGFWYPHYGHEKAKNQKDQNHHENNVINE